MWEKARKLLLVCIVSIAFAAGGAFTAYGASYNSGIFVDDGSVYHIPESSDITVTDGYFSMLVDGSGSTISADDYLTMEVNIDYIVGAIAAAGGTIRIGRSADITMYGSQSKAALASDGGKIYIGDGAVIRTDGIYANAVEAIDGGFVNLGNGGTIETYGNDANGLTAASWSSLSFIKAGDDLKITTYSNINNGGTFDNAHGIWAEQIGFVEVGDRLAVTTYGAKSYGIGAQGDGVMVEIGDGGTISTYGYHALGLWVKGNGGTASITAGEGLTVNTSYNQADEGNPFEPDSVYDYAYGIHAEGGGSAYIGNKLTISTLGSSSHGVYAQASDQDALVKIGKSADITTEGEVSCGLFADKDGAAVYADDGLKVTTLGNYSYGVNAYGYGLLDIGGGARISTNGFYSAAAIAEFGGILNLGGGAVISTEGIYSAGLSASERSRVYAGDGLSIVTGGEDSHGVIAQYTGVIEVGKNADISTSGTGGKGVSAASDSRILVGEDLKVNTAGNSAYGISASQNSYIEIGRGSQIITAGEGAHAVYALNGGDITIDGGIIIAGDASANAIFSAGGYDFFNRSLIRGTGLFSIYGDVVAEANDMGIAKVDLTLENGSVLTGAAVEQGTNAEEAELLLSLHGNDTRWNITGDSILTELELDGSTVDFAGSAFGTEIVTDTLGGDGGLFIMKADMLGIGDKLIVNGTSSGSHTIMVISDAKAATDGTETQTIVENTYAGARFALADAGADFELMYGFTEFGAWLYGLRAVNGAAGNWELYGAGISNAASAAVNAIAAGYLMGYAEMNTLVQRLGELRDTPHRSGFWGRVHGGKFNTDGMSLGKEFDLKYGGVHIGYDRKVENEWNGDLYVGVMFGYSKGDIDFARAGGDGDVDSKTIGVYGTYKQADGWYVDAVLKYQWIGHGFNTFNSAGAKVTTNDVDSGGFGFSIEAGKRFELKKGWYVEPQAQLSYLKQDGGTFDMRNGPSFYSDGWTSLQGRLGARVGYEKGAHGFYAKVSWVKEFDGDFDFKANGVPLTDSFGDNWWVYGIGYVSKLNDRNSIYLDIERSSGGVFEQDWAVKAGWRITL